MARPCTARAPITSGGCGGDDDDDDDDENGGDDCGGENGDGGGAIGEEDKGRKVVRSVEVRVVVIRCKVLG